MQTFVALITLAFAVQIPAILASTCTAQGSISTNIVPGAAEEFFSINFQKDGNDIDGGCASDNTGNCNFCGSSLTLQPAGLPTSFQFNAQCDTTTFGSCNGDYNGNNGINGVITKMEGFSDTQSFCTITFDC